MKQEITITIKFFSGIHNELSLPDYDLGKGITITSKKGIRLKKILKNLGLGDLSSNIYFCKGERIGLWKKPEDGDEISCLKPSGGG